MKKYTTILFDLDGTLCDFDQSNKDSLSEVYSSFILKRYYYSVDNFLYSFKACNSKALEKLHNAEIAYNSLIPYSFKLCFNNVNVFNNELICDVANSYNRLLISHTRLLPNVIDTLRYLAAKYKLYVISNGSQLVQVAKLRKCNIHSYFAHVFTSSEIGFPKPKVEFYSEVLKNIGEAKQNCIAIGDNELTDILGAKNSGIDSIWYCSDKEKISNSQYCKHYISNIGECMSIL